MRLVCFQFVLPSGWGSSKSGRCLFLRGEHCKIPRGAYLLQPIGRLTSVRKVKPRLSLLSTQWQNQWIISVQISVKISLQYLISAQLDTSAQIDQFVRSVHYWVSSYLISPCQTTIWLTPQVLCVVQYYFPKQGSSAEIKEVIGYSQYVDHLFWVFWVSRWVLDPFLAWTTSSFWSTSSSSRVFSYF